jgi:ABC-type oligopeptide transport system substrate-binding subunit
LVRQWREELGIETQMSMTPLDDFFKRTGGQNAPAIYMKGWMADYPDPDNMLRLPLPEIIHSDQRFRKLIEDARLLTDQEARLALYRKADELIVQEALVVPLKYTVDRLLVGPRVRKYPASGKWRDFLIEPE